MEGPSRAMIFLYGRIMVLGELLMGWSEWGPTSHSWRSGLGELVIDSRFLAVNPYSSRDHLIGPEGSPHFFEEKPWIVSSQDSNMGQDARGTCVPRY